MDGLRLEKEKIVQVVKLITEGLGIRQTARVVDCDPHTVLGVLETVAQCASYDFAAQGATIEEAQANFSGTVNAHIALCLKHGEIPFSNVPPPPSWFGRDFEMIQAESQTQEIGERSAKHRMIFKHAFAGV